MRIKQFIENNEEIIREYLELKAKLIDKLKRIITVEEELFEQFTNYSKWKLYW